MLDLADRRQFLIFGATFEGALIALAFGIGWFVEMSPLAQLRLEWMALVWGLAGTVPLVILFLLSFRFPLGPLQPIRRFLVDMLGPSLAACRWYDLLLFSLLVGFSEELLFRGVLQPWFSHRWGPTTGLVASNVLFGLAHFVTPMYAALASVMGAYLGWLLGRTSEPNLLVPILTHALYDFVAFMIVRRTYRTEQEQQELLDPRADEEAFDR